LVHLLLLLLSQLLCHSASSIIHKVLSVLSLKKTLLSYGIPVYEKGASPSVAQHPAVINKPPFAQSSVIAHFLTWEPFIRDHMQNFTSLNFRFISSKMKLPLIELLFSGMNWNKRIGTWDCFKRFLVNNLHRLCNYTITTEGYSTSKCIFVLILFVLDSACDNRRQNLQSVGLCKVRVMQNVKDVNCAIKLANLRHFNNHACMFENITSYQMYYTKHNWFANSLLFLHSILLPVI
jgi:hypothetical protein